MSVCRGFAQPVTRNFVTTTATARLVQYSTLSTGAGVTDIGGVISIDTAANLTTYINTHNSAGVTIAANRLLEDLGKNVYVSLAGVNTRVLHFRLVKVKNGSVASGGESIIPATDYLGYVLVESDVSTDVRVARV
jgi:hypothetical protein